MEDWMLDDDDDYDDDDRLALVWRWRFACDDGGAPHGKGGLFGTVATTMYSGERWLREVLFLHAAGSVGGVVFFVCSVVCRCSCCCCWFVVVVVGVVVRGRCQMNA